MARLDRTAGQQSFRGKAAATTDTARRYVPTCGGSPSPHGPAIRQDGEACARPPPPDPPNTMCRLLVGLPDVVVLGVDACAGAHRWWRRWNVRGVLPVSVSTKISGPGGPLRRSTPTEDWQQDCPGCGTRGWVKQRPVVRLTDFTLVRSTPLDPK